MKARRWLLLASSMLAAGLFPWAGCQSTRELDLQRKINRLNDTIADKNNQLAAQRATIDGLHDQLQVARALTDKDLEKLFYPEKILIDTLSGGDDYDGQPGDDGVTVYLKPIDRDGDPIKVAGDVRIELYDLANPPDQNLIGQYVIPVEEVSRLWYGKLATYHYTIRCPWQNGPPQHTEITIRATFVDYLTRRVITAQSLCTVTLPP